MSNELRAPVGEAIATVVDQMAREFIVLAVDGLEHKIQTGTLTADIDIAIAHAGAQALIEGRELDPERVLMLAVGELMRSHIDRTSKWIASYAGDIRRVTSIPPAPIDAGEPGTEAEVTP